MNKQVTLPGGEEAPQNFLQRYALAFKVALIAFFILLLLIPMGMIKGLIWEREQTARQAITDVHNTWSRAQMVIGPILTIPYTYSLEEGKVIREYLHLLPDQLTIEGNIQTKELKRGIYEIIVYHAPMQLKGKFSPIDLVSHNLHTVQLYPKEAILSLGISDLRGIKQRVAIQWGEEKLIFNPGTEKFVPVSSGVSLHTEATPLLTGEKDISFSIDLQLQGSESILFAPIGKTTHVALTSNCPTPSFTGAYLPDKRDITKEGFSAQWDILDLNRNYGQVIKGNSNTTNMNITRQASFEYETTSSHQSGSNIGSSAFGVNLLLPVHQYQKVTRSVKYAFLIIILTFVVNFFVEIIQKKNIHPFQYLLVGLALCLFYTLLLSTSEHINFIASYWLSTVMTVGLITFYMMGVLKIKKTALSIGGLLLLLYTYIFFLIQMESYALLAGSIGLFIILAIIMRYSQKIKL